MKSKLRNQSIALVATIATATLSIVALSTAHAATTSRSRPVTASVGRANLRRVGRSSLGRLGQNQPSTLVQPGFAPSPGEHFISTDPDNNSVFSAGGSHAGNARLHSASGPTPITARNVPRTVGFQGVTGPSQASVNNGGDLEPPDQALCSDGTSVVDDVNNALQVYSISGQALTGPVAATRFYHAADSAFFADPRCYYDPPTHRWFFTQFDLANFRGDHETSPSVQYIAVSNTPDVLGSYTIYALNSDDATTSGCPCFGDFDQIGADANGFYVSVNEFGDFSGAFNGAIIYAYSKKALENTGFGEPQPGAIVYRLLSDPFGQPYHVAPAQSPLGARYAKGTEYFVESNSDANRDHKLVVYALTKTGRLQAGEAPTLVETTVKSEPYAFPPDAAQPAGYSPLAHKVAEPIGKLQADFNAIQEVTYTNGKLYAEADTAAVGHRDGVAWFVLAPTLQGTALTVAVSAQGYVTSPGVNLLYPDIAVDNSGRGYLVMSLTGSFGQAKYYPSAAYQAFGLNGPRGPIREAAVGTAPEDGFTCYAAFVGPGYGGCRWGDYSMGVAAGGRIIMGAEYVPASSRDFYTNWGTFVWSSPTP